MNDGRSESGGWKIDAAAIEASMNEARLWSLERRLNPTHSPLEPHPPFPTPSHSITTTTPKMAAATSTRLTQQDQDHLRDYSIRLTGAPTPPQAEEEQHISRPPSPSPNLESPSLAQQQNPPGWESSYRQVPPHRPVNRNLDAESRPWGAHGGQSPVIFAMMHGVWLKAVRLFSVCSFAIWVVG